MPKMLRALFSLVSVLIIMIISQSGYSVPGLDELELGYQYGHRIYDDHVVHNKPYLLARSTTSISQSDKTGSLLQFNWGIRAWTDVKDHEIQPKSLSLGYSQSFLKLEVGFQEISWGETFGISISDIINPRDFRDPLLNEPSWYRLPIFAGQLQLFLGPLTLQGVVVPVPRNNQYPEIGTSSDLTAALKQKAGVAHVVIEDPSPFKIENSADSVEMGGKASVLFDFGLDLGLFYYLHWNRNLVFNSTLSGSTSQDLTLTLSPIQRKVDSFGMTASQAIGPFVLRGDAIYHHLQPLQAEDFSRPAFIGTEIQSIFGGDLTLESGWMIAGQGHYTKSSFHELVWVSFKTGIKILKDKLEPEFFYFKGINNEDTWFQPKMTWNMTGSVTVALSADFLDGDEKYGKSSLFGLTDQDRFLTTLSIKF